MSSRKDITTPVVTRNVARDKHCSNLMGDQVEIIKRCPDCNEVKPIVEFYSAARRVSKSCNDTRNICVECWDKESKMYRLKREGKIPYIGGKLPI
jgi:hypothetical protein